MAYRPHGVAGCYHAPKHVVAGARAGCIDDAKAGLTASQEQRLEVPRREVLERAYWLAGMGDAEVVGGETEALRQRVEVRRCRVADDVGEPWFSSMMTKM